MKTILIVEDDAATAHIYRTALTRAGYEVFVADNGQKGLEFLMATSPDGVLLDLMLPKVKGLDLLRTMRAEPHLAKIPIIVYTFADTPSQIKKACEEGATEVYAKSKLTPGILIRAFAETIKPDLAA